MPLEHLAEYTASAHRDLREARHARHLVRARLGRLPARAADPQSASRQGREGDAGDRRGGLRPGARLQGLAFGRARRRHRALRVPRAHVRLAPGARLRGGEGSLRSRTACSIPAASCARRNSTIRTLLRFAPGYHGEPMTTELDWSDYPGAGGGFQGAVEMCNNNGACRKIDGRRHVPELHGDAQRARRHARARQYAAARGHRPARRRTRSRPTRWPRR